MSGTITQEYNSTSSDDEPDHDRRVRQRTNKEGYRKHTNPYRQKTNSPEDQKHDTGSDMESESTVGNHSETNITTLDHGKQDKARNTHQASAWREIFRKYRIRSIQQATTVTEKETPLIQPIIFQQSENTSIGDDFEPIDDKKIFRIYYQNVNGISTSKGTSKWNEINATMAKNKVAMFGLTETNVDWNKHKNQAIMTLVLRKHFRHATMQTSTSTMKFTDDYNLGGTCTVTTNNWTGRILTQICDNTGQGRWSGNIIRAHWFNIAVITAYRVTQRAIEQAGPTTAYAQQWAVSRQQGIDRPEPRTQFITDIKRLLKKLKKDGNKIILMMDVNETMGSEKSGVSSIASDCKLIDAHTARHQEAATTTT
jgi:hypothetical protein